MKSLLFAFLLLFTPLAFGQSCTQVPVVTGFGYLTNSQGQIFAYAQYPEGSICIPTGQTYTEVANQSALPPLYVAPPTADQQQEELIREDSRALAIQDLQNQGILTSGQASTALSTLTNLQTVQNTAQVAKAQVQTH